MRFTLYNLGSHVAFCADQLSVSHVIQIYQLNGASKVCQGKCRINVPIAQDNVLRLDVSVNNVPLVEVGYALTNLKGIVLHMIFRK